MKKEIIEIPIEDIVPDEKQPRKYFNPVKIRTLKESISKYGVMNPVTVEKIGGKYLLVDGERRFRAASEIKLKSIPAMVIAPQSAVERLIQQFHIQEQHEEWSPVEKAQTVGELSKEIKISVVELSRMLGIDETNTKRFTAFSSLIDKKEFVKNEIPIEWASYITSVCNNAEKISNNNLKEPFTQNDRRSLERIIIAQVKNGDIRRPTELTKLKDSFSKEPKSLTEFLKGKKSVAEIFLGTKAQDARLLRQAAYMANYASGKITLFLKTRDAIPTESQIKDIKTLKNACEDFLKVVE